MTSAATHYSGARESVSWSDVPGTSTIGCGVRKQHRRPKLGAKIRALFMERERCHYWSWRQTNQNCYQMYFLLPDDDTNAHQSIGSGAQKYKFGAATCRYTMREVDLFGSASIS